jgi:hypothetical protein
MVEIQLVLSGEMLTLLNRSRRDLKELSIL